MKVSRRDFIRHSGLATAGTLLVPRFVSAFPRFRTGDFSGKRLVVIQLSGGNDGLNTVIPYRNDHYYRLRPNIGIARQQALRLTDELALNPGMTGLRDLYDQACLTIINNVGYPNPNMSHFRSMDIWHTASDSDQYLSSGWVGRYLDNSCQGCAASSALEIDDTLSLAMKGRQASAVAVQNPNLLYQLARKNRASAALFEVKNDREPSLDYLYKTLESTLSSAEYIHDQSKIFKSSVDYPRTKIGRHLKLTAELIISRIETQVFYLSMGGFDTHVHQINRQERLLQEYSDGLAAFVQDLKQNDAFKDTLILTFSEFGRRVAENGSSGTDHGRANNMFIIGGNLRKPGIYNEIPNLVDLDEGNLQFSIDFRQVYATALDKWLSASSEQVLGKAFESLAFI